MRNERRLMAGIAALLLLVAAGGEGPADRAAPQAVVELPPAAAAAEVERIRRHLATVESALRARDTGGLSADRRARRAVALDWLREYRLRDLFPHNHTHPGRRVPVFVDEHGTHCAVGYLLKRAGEAELVDAVVAGDNNIRVRELAGNARFRTWLEETGLTLEEAAWIQPKYGGDNYGFVVEPKDHELENDLFITQAGGIATGLLALYSLGNEPGPGHLQVTGVLNGAAALFHAGMAVRIGKRETVENSLWGAAINGVLSAISGYAAVNRFQRSGRKRFALRAEARDEEPRGASVVGERFQVSLPEPAWIHGRLGVHFRAVH